MSFTTALIPAECVTPECDKPPDFGTVDRRSKPWGVWFMCHDCFMQVVAGARRRMEQLLEGGVE